MLVKVNDYNHVQVFTHKKEFSTVKVIHLEVLYVMSCMQSVG